MEYDKSVYFQIFPQYICNQKIKLKKISEVVNSLHKNEPISSLESLRNWDLGEKPTRIWRGRLARWGSRTEGFDQGSSYRNYFILSIDDEMREESLILVLCLWRKGRMNWEEESLNSFVSFGNFNNLVRIISCNWKLAYMCRTLD